MRSSQDSKLVMSLILSNQADCRDMFPDYLAFLRAKIEDDLAARDTGDVRHALLRLQDSPLYQTLLVSSHIKRNNLFDLDLSRESK